MYIGLWALEEPSCVAWICVLRFWFVILLRCGRLPFASQLGWLGPLRHRADIGQTQLHLSFLRHESRAAVLPPSSGAAWQRQHAWEMREICLGRLSRRSTAPA